MEAHRKQDTQKMISALTLNAHMLNLEALNPKPAYPKHHTLNPVSPCSAPCHNTSYSSPHPSPSLTGAFIASLIAIPLKGALKGTLILVAEFISPQKCTRSVL